MDNSSPQNFHINTYKSNRLLREVLLNKRAKERGGEREREREREAMARR
jgi:hypothetical protein